MSIPHAKAGDIIQLPYSLGCSLFHLLTGENVYKGETVMKKLFAHATGPIPSLMEKRPDAPA